ncbi:MAG TPA: amidase [Aliidongia sp.]|uniref:amidase n=1 Tax=Aliidongia sp. TaxID=1914230 RepID=UPI002DDD2E7A|nr:amidase [Aliidongia sp.]HEV2673109.1 amidase [Aliidongia sp.]
MRRKQLSATEYLTELLDAIAAENATLHAFIDVYRADALGAARDADERVARGIPCGPLQGLPFAVKDLIDVQGQPTTAQSRLLLDNIARRDATVVRRMRDAGAILVGKLALEEFGIGSPADLLPWPPALNPWDIGRTPGGSSSGCGVALAAGQIPLAIGTDTAGSVRNPAAMCGVIGLKPSYDLISRRGVFPLSPSLDHVGVMARSAEDCSLLLDAVRRRPRRPDPISFGAEDSRPLHGLRLGMLTQFYERDLPADDATRAALATAADLLSGLGAHLEEVETTDLQSYRRCGAVILQWEAFQIHRRTLSRSPEHYGARCREELLKGATIQAADYREAQRHRRSLSLDIDRLLETSDLLMTGVSPEPAFRMDDADGPTRSGNGMRIVFNVTGHPALSFCVGFSEQGLPIGGQLVGRRHQESTLLTVAAAYQRATGWHRRQPAFSTEHPQHS